MSKMKLDMRSALGGLSLVPEAPAVDETVDETPAATTPATSPAAAASAAAPAEKPAKKPPAKRPAAPRKAPDPKPAASPGASTDSSGPRWTEFELKTTRLRSDQFSDLTALRRQLTKAKGGAGERITENTLIRVAVDLLLERSHELRGTTEAELGASLGLHN